MMVSLYSAVSGLKVHQTKMDVVGNNISNVNTTGYKKDQVTFQDLLNQTYREANAAAAGAGGINPAQIGTGVMIGAINTIHSQGAPATTSNATDVMIQGEGFFILSRDTDVFYSRAGVFTFDNEGYLVNAPDGKYVLDDGGAQIQIPNIETVKSIGITSSGEVTYIDDTGTSSVAGTIGIAKFANPAGLMKAGSNMYTESQNSGVAAVGVPGFEGRGLLVSNSLEMSNVDLAEEFINMIITQRGYQANSKTIRTSDEMLQELINIKR